MSSLFKYILVSLVFFVLLTVVSYRFLRPRSAGKAALSSQMEAQFVNDAQLLDTLYRSYKVAIKGTDPIVLIQTKGNFQTKLGEMNQRPIASTALDTIFRRVVRNYRFTVKVNEQAIQNQKNLAGNKQLYKDRIEQLTKSNARLEQTIAFIQAQPPPAPAPIK